MSSGYMEETKNYTKGDILEQFQNIDCESRGFQCISEKMSRQTPN